MKSGEFKGIGKILHHKLYWWYCNLSKIIFIWAYYNSSDSEVYIYTGVARNSQQGGGAKYVLVRILLVKHFILQGIIGAARVRYM